MALTELAFTIMPAVLHSQEQELPTLLLLTRVELYTDILEQTHQMEHHLDMVVSTLLLVQLEIERLFVDGAQGCHPVSNLILLPMPMVVMLIHIG